MGKQPSNPSEYEDLKPPEVVRPLPQPKATPPKAPPIIPPQVERKVPPIVSKKIAPPKAEVVVPLPQVPWQGESFEQIQDAVEPPKAKVQQKPVEPAKRVTVTTKIPDHTEKHTSPNNTQKQNPNSNKPQNQQAVVVVAVVILTLAALIYVTANNNDSPTTYSSTSASKPSAYQGSKTVASKQSQPIASQSKASPNRTETQLAGNNKGKQATVGSVKIAAYRMIGNDRREVRGKALISIRDSDDRVQEIDIQLPAVLRNVGPRAYNITLATKGYENMVWKNVFVGRGKTNNLIAELKQSDTTIRFVVPTSKKPFDVYVENKYLGTSEQLFKFTPIKSHRVTLRNDGWRDKVVTFQLDNPGENYELKVKPERITSGIRITIDAGRHAPTSAYIWVIGNPPKLVKLPYERTDMSATGIFKFAVAIDGYQIPDKTQSVILVDRKTTNVVIKAKKLSWLNKVF